MPFYRSEEEEFKEYIKDTMVIKTATEEKNIIKLFPGQYVLSIPEDNIAEMTLVFKDNETLDNKTLDNKENIDGEVQTGEEA